MTLSTHLHNKGPPAKGMEKERKMIKKDVSGCFSFCLISYKLKISQEQNRFLSRETNFSQLSNVASSGLKKMLI